MIVKLVMVMVLCAPSVLAQKTKLLTESDAAAIAARGRFLFDYDTASWYATDAVMALKPAEGSVARYIARKTDTGWIVVFGRFNEAKDGFLIVYEATQGSGLQQFTVKTYDPPQKDIGFFYTAARAIGIALQDFRREKRPYNTYVLPLDSGQLYVYVLPAQTVADIYPLGGDVRYLISADGSAIVETRVLHKSILEIKNSEKSGKLAAGVHTHILSDIPEDTDVFHVLRRKPSVPEMIATKKGLYMIETDGTIGEKK